MDKYNTIKLILSGMIAGMRWRGLQDRGPHQIQGCPV